MMIKALSNLLIAVSVINVFPVDAAVLEWQTLSADEQMAGQVLGASQFGNLLYATTASLPVAKDKVIPPPIKIDPQSFGVVTSAKSAVVIDKASGATLFAKNANEVRPIGSISKLMAALVFLETKPNLDEYVTVTPDDFAGTGRVYLYYNDALQLRDVLGASLVGSDNTATLALTRLSGLTQTEFVNRMNTKAAQLGMGNSHFEDPSGLSAANVSTTGELAILLTTAQKQPDMAEFMSTATLHVQQASGRVAVIPSTNLLLSSPLNTGDYAVTAGKTGYIPQAGYCLATAVEFEDNEILVIVLGAEDINARFTDAMALSGWAFKTFDWSGL